MKRIFLMLLVLALTLTICSCNSEVDNNPITEYDEETIKFDLHQGSDITVTVELADSGATCFGCNETLFTYNVYVKVRGEEVRDDYYQLDCACLDETCTNYYENIVNRQIDDEELRKEIIEKTKEFIENLKYSGCKV